MSHIYVLAKTCYIYYTLGRVPVDTIIRFTYAPPP